MMLMDELPASTGGAYAVVVHALATVENLCLRGLQALKRRRLNGYRVACAMIDLHCMICIESTRSPCCAL